MIQKRLGIVAKTRALPTASSGRPVRASASEKSKGTGPANRATVRRRRLLIATIMGVMTTGLAGCFTRFFESTLPQPEIPAADFESFRVDGEKEMHRRHVRVWGNPLGSSVTFSAGIPDHFLTSMRLLDALSPDARILAYDRLGVGFSDKPTDQSGLYQLDSQVAELHEILLRRGKLPTTIIAHSYGAAVAVAYADRYPDRVRSLVLLDPITIPEPEYAELFGGGAGFLANSFIGPIALLFHTRSITASGLRDVVAHPETVSEEMVDLYHVPFQTEGAHSAFRQSIADLREETRANWERSAAGIKGRKIPVLLFWGEQDQNVSVGKAEEIRDCLGAELILLPDCGHMPILELSDVRFQEELLSPLKRFLSR